MNIYSLMMCKSLKKSRLNQLFQAWYKIYFILKILLIDHLYYLKMIFKLTKKLINMNSKKAIKLRIFVLFAISWLKTNLAVKLIIKMLLCSVNIFSIKIVRIKLNRMKSISVCKEEYLMYKNLIRVNKYCQAN